MQKREFRCFYEGLQEKLYFKHVSNVIRNVDKNISVKFKEVGKLNSLENSSTEVPKIAVFDYDLNKTEFEDKVKLCKETKVLYSNLNFDLWLLLHKEKYTKNEQSNHAYIEKVREVYKLPKTADIKKKDNIEKILEQIELEDIKRAINNAEEIMKGKLEEDRIFVRKNFSYFSNPSMNINEFFKDLFKELGI